MSQQQGSFFIEVIIAMLLLCVITLPIFKSLLMLTHHLNQTEVLTKQLLAR